VTNDLDAKVQAEAEKLSGVLSKIDAKKFSDLVYFLSVEERRMKIKLRTEMTRLEV